MSYFDDNEHQIVYGPHGRFREPKPACKHCGTRAVRWHHTGERWVLLGDDNKIHACGPVATADDFEDVS